MLSNVRADVCACCVRDDHFFVQATKEADSNAALLSDAYLEFLRIQSLANNTKIYFGDKIPSLYVDRADTQAGAK